MTSQLLNDPEHWRERARIIRNLSAEMVDPVSKSLMLKIADDYEVLAQRAEDRVAHRAAITEQMATREKEPDHL